MTNEKQSGDAQIPAIWQRFAEVTGTSAAEAREVLAESIMPKASRAELLTFLAVCGQYDLNPLRKEIYAFPSRAGIQPIVSVDGWLAIANRHPDHDAIESEEIRDDAGALVAVRARVWKKGSERATTATEYLSECQRNTDPWRQWPTRMLTNKAMIQAIRRAYAVSGIMEPDEAERIGSEERVEKKTSSTRETLIERAKAATKAAPDAGFDESSATVPTPDDQIVEAEYEVTAEDMADWTTNETTDPEATR